MQSQYVRYLYFHQNFYTYKEFVQNELEIYSRWFHANPEDKNHLLFYGIFLLETEERNRGSEILSEIYNPDNAYNFDDVSWADLSNFLCGLVFGKFSKAEFEGTFYEDFFDYSMEEIIGMIAE